VSDLRRPERRLDDVSRRPERRARVHAGDDHAGRRVSDQPRLPAAARPVDRRDRRPPRADHRGGDALRAAVGNAAVRLLRLLPRRRRELAFAEPAVACTSNDECSQPFEACEQNAQGAFAPGGGRASTVSLRGSRIGDLRDGQPHPATLVSAFCVPPTFDPLIDAAANLPGPGAVSLPGSSQIFR
jgi:hypothetical protein